MREFIRHRMAQGAKWGTRVGLVVTFPVWGATASVGAAAGIVEGLGEAVVRKMAGKEVPMPQEPVRDPDMFRDMKESMDEMAKGFQAMGDTFSTLAEELRKARQRPKAADAPEAA